jgi:hypothetical protein
MKFKSRDTEQGRAVNALADVSGQRESLKSK